MSFLKSLVSFFTVGKKTSEFKLDDKGQQTYEISKDGVGVFFGGQGGGDDVVNGNGYSYAVKFDLTLSQVLGYELIENGIRVDTPWGSKELHAVDRIALKDSLFAFDTQRGESTWQAYALLKAGFGAAPDKDTLSRWVKAAEDASSMDDLAQKMIDHYAPGIASEDLVTHLYIVLTGHVPTVDEVAHFVSQIGEGKTFPTQGALFSFAADLEELNDTSAILGLPVELSLDWFPELVNLPPLEISLSAGVVNENASGAVVGVLSVIDPDDDTHSFTVDDARFEVVGNQLKLKVGESLDHEAAATVTVTVTATDAGGLNKAQGFAIAVLDVAETTFLTGTAGADTFNNAAGLDDFIINALAGNDTITTGSGNDIVRPGEGVDTVHTGAGNDIVVVVGQSAANQYTQSDIDNPSGSGINLSSIITLADLNGRTLSEVQPGESIDGGAGTNRLVIYGNVDFTGVTLANITQFQVNSNLTISAQQLNALGLNLIFGDGDSVINIVNPSGDPVTVDLSGVHFSDLKTLNLGANVTLVVDQADVADLLYLTGSGTLRASDASGTLNLAGKYTSLAIQDKDGVPHLGHGGSIVNGDLLIASEAGETLSGGDGDDRLLGGDGNDILNGGAGNDILRGGKGYNEMHGGAGDDRFVIVGDLSGGGKIDSNEDTDVLGFPLTTLNGKTFGEDVGGGVIRGGEGNDTLYVFGTADLSDWDIEGIENIEIRSDVTFYFNDEFFDKNKIKSIKGDGISTLRIESDKPTTVDVSTLEALKLSGIGHIDLGKNVTLQVTNLDQLGGARILTGTGKIEAKGGQIALPNTYSVETGLTFTNINDSAVDKISAVVGKKNGVIEDTPGNNYMPGTDYADTFKSINGGNDVMSGKKGSDTYYIAGSGTKTILDVNNQDNGSDKDTINLSLVASTIPGSDKGAIIDLTDGGKAGDATIQLGTGSLTGGTTKDSQKTNLMIIFDDSGSMWGERLQKAKLASIELFDTYDNVGDVAVRIINFGHSATSSFNGFDGWMDVTTAKNVINSFTAPGWSTNYSAAMDTAISAWSTGRGDTYYSNATNVSFFLSDGEPESSVYQKEHVWENFLIQNQITSHALGFGGISNNYHLEPLAFDGTKVKNINDDHTPGEIPAIITLNLNKLVEDVVAQAKVDFIENVIGTDFNDELIGNSLNNRIDGGKGDDVLKGMGGNDILIGGDGIDTAVFRGNKADYSFDVMSKVGDTAWLRVTDGVSGRDGSDVLSYSIEKMKFEGHGEVVDIADFLKTLGPVKSAEDIFKDYDPYGSISENWFKFFFDLSKAAYFHTDTHKEMGAGSKAHIFIDDKSSVSALNSSQVRTESDAYSYLVQSDIGYEQLKEFDTESKLTSTFKNSGGQTFAFDYQIKDGWYIASSNKIPGLDTRSSVAMLGTSEDGKSLFVTFRGTDVTVDWVDDLYDMYGHYQRYHPLFTLLKDYINNPDNRVENVYVSGHSLGGQMATWFMADNKGDDRFSAVLFEPANKGRLIDPVKGWGYSHPTFDDRIVSFETENDPVPDLGGFSVTGLPNNPGKVIHLNVDGYPLPATLHGMGAMQLPFMQSIPYLDKDALPTAQRVYSQYGSELSTDGGLGKTFLDLAMGVVLGKISLPVAKAEAAANAIENAGVALGGFSVYVAEITSLVLDKIAANPGGFLMAYINGPVIFKNYMNGLVTKADVENIQSNVLATVAEHANVNIFGETLPMLNAAFGYFAETYLEMIQTGYDFLVANSGIMSTPDKTFIDETGKVSSAKLTIEQIPFYSLITGNNMVYEHTQSDITHVEIKPFVVSEDVFKYFKPLEATSKVLTGIDTLFKKFLPAPYKVLLTAAGELSFISTATGKLLDQKISIDASDWVGKPGAELIIEGNYDSNKVLGSKVNDVIDGRWGDDIIFGNAGNDILVGSGDADILIGGAGNDLLLSYTVNDSGLKAGATDEDFIKYLFREEFGLGNDVFEAFSEKYSITERIDAKEYGVLYGGEGGNTMIGINGPASLNPFSKRGDAFFVDSKSSGHDTIYNFDFKASGLTHGVLVDDKIVLSASQLGLSTNSLTNNKKDPYEIFSGFYGYKIDNDLLEVKTEVNFDSLKLDEDTSFLLDVWKDQDWASLYFVGDGKVIDRLADIRLSSYTSDARDFHAPMIGSPFDHENLIIADNFDPLTGLVLV